MFIALRAAACLLSLLFFTSETWAEASLWNQKYSELPKFEARGWSETDFTAKGCEKTREGLRVCRYALFGAAEVFAVGEEFSDETSTISLKCRCDSDTFRTFAVYLMRAANTEPDEILSVLLVSVLAKTVLVTDGMTFSAWRDEAGFMFVMTVND
ncbi:hypothetical protein E0J18_11835 [Rhizobium leguminosarum bv. viciae]|nr:hypothetical protein E0J18_11835 [Rhizobium leguminosarum bv. viciae]